MKKLLFIFIIIYSSFSFAQNDTINRIKDNSINKSIEDELPVPSLDSLFKWAEEYSPTLKQSDALIEKTGADTKRVKKNWMEAIKFSANLSKGSYGNSVINQLETGYSFGPFIQFSLYNLASNHNLVNVYKAEEKVAFYKKEESKLELHNTIIILYNNVQSQKNIFKIKTEAVNAAYIHQKMAEKEFNNGAIAIGELSRVTEIYTKAQTDAEITINDLKNNYLQLQQICNKIFYK